MWALNVLILFMAIHGEKKEKLTVTVCLYPLTNLTRP